MQGGLWVVKGGLLVIGLKKCDFLLVSDILML